MSETQALEAPGRPAIRTGNIVSRWWKNPWRKPHVLEAITWGYLAWSLLPVIIAIIFSLNDGRSRSTWQGFSLQWWWVADPRDTEALVHRPDLTHAMFQSVLLSAATMVIAVPLGVLFAIGLDRWRGRGRGITNFAMLFSFVIPEIILSVALSTARPPVREQPDRDHEQRREQHDGRGRVHRRRRGSAGDLIDLDGQRVRARVRRERAHRDEVVDRIGEHDGEAREDRRIQQRQQHAADRLRRFGAEVHRGLLVLLSDGE